MARVNCTSVAISGRILSVKLAIRHIVPVPDALHVVQPPRLCRDCSTVALAPICDICMSYVAWLTRSPAQLE